MISFLSIAMSTATGRFLTFELERNNEAEFAKIFSMSMTIYLGIVCLLVVFSETVGLWFVNHQLVIPQERMPAANWAYQCAVGTLITSILVIPYQSAVIAHEKMGVYAYLGVAEGTSRLAIAFALLGASGDKLKLYAALMLFMSIGISLIPRVYCWRHFKGCRYSFFWDKALFKTLVSYSGWNLFGALAAMVRGQGINILLNMFFGPLVNASRAVAFQVSALINSFMNNFFMAANPQIIKHYSAGNSEGMLNLVFHTARYCYYLVLILSLPVLLGTEVIMRLWLKDPPQHVVVFTRLVILNGLIDSLSLPLMTAAQATGRIKRYQVIVGGMIILNLPVSYLFLKGGAPPESAFVISILISCLCLWQRLALVRRQVPSLSIKSFVFEVLGRVLKVTTLACLAPFAVLFCTGMEGFSDLLVVTFACLVSCVTVIYFAGMNAEERDFVRVLVETKLLRYVRTPFAGS
ncbi:MAG: hypothetical protein BWY44_00532 [Candidatus Omnitrophica bacterium ADurb.Bin292]|nr:MAG: hypothetical protein BWY44_00532 [Candidatus Omnitrophica bacterium ADurb.Bin292]